MWIEILLSTTEVRIKFRDFFGKQPPSHLSIRNMFNKWKLTGSMANNYKNNSGRKKSVRIDEKIDRVKNAVLSSNENEEPISTRIIQKQEKISQTSALRILHLDLKMKPFQSKMVPQLSDNDKILRMFASEELLQIIQSHQPSPFLFSDEAKFHVSGFVNSHNQVYWATEHPHQTFEYVDHSPKVNVWCGISIYGIVGPFFFKEPTVASKNY